MKAHEAEATFAIRRRTAQEAGIDAYGIDETLAALRLIAGSADVLLFHFLGQERVVTVFVSPDERILGCVRVARKLTHPLL